MCTLSFPPMFLAGPSCGAIPNINGSGESTLGKELQNHIAKGTDIGRGKNRGHDLSIHSRETKTSDAVRTLRQTELTRLTEVWQVFPERVKLKVKSERPREMKSVKGEVKDFQAKETARIKFQWPKET